MLNLKSVVGSRKGTYFEDLIAYIKSIEKRTTQNNDIYYNVILSDKESEVEAKIWSNAFDYVPVQKLENGVVLKINGTVSVYNGVSQIIIEKAKILQSGEYDESLLFPLTSQQILKLESQLFDYINMIQNEKLRNTLQAIFSDQYIHDAFVSAPAGEIIHHAYKGGLLEHTVEVIDIALSIYKHYENYANKDAVIAGAMLHDLGKIYEYDNTSFKRTINGYLIGHIVLGMQIFNKFWNKAQGESNEALKAHIIHIILAHHTELEYGAVVRPATLEASIVAQADYASSTVKQFAQEHAKIDPEQGIAPYNKYLRTKVIKIE